MITTRRWWVLLAISAGSLMAGLDNSVSNTVLPVVATSLRADVTTTQWVVLIYLLLTTVLVLSAGRLGDLHGHRRLYLVGTAIFIATSAACGFAPSIGWLIAARGCQALGAALLVSNAPAILTSTFPDQMRGRVLGLQATAVYLGTIIGPAAGGFLTTRFDWGAVFLVNVPIGVVALLLSLRFLPRDITQPSKPDRFDVPGAGTFSIALVLLILGLNQADAWGWTSPGLGGCLLAAGALLAAFVRIEQRASAPLLDLNLFRNRKFSTAIASVTLHYAATFTMFFVLPFFFIRGRGMTPAEAGLVLAAVPVLMPVLSPLSGALSDRIGTRLPATGGVAIAATTLFALSRTDVDTPLVCVVGLLVLFGLGMGLFTSPITSAILGSVPRERRGVASGLVSTARGLGMVLGFCLGGTVYASALSRIGAGAAPASVTEAAGLTLLVAAGIATLATAALISCRSGTSEIAVGHASVKSAHCPTPAGSAAPDPRPQPRPRPANAT
jgi:EmrB/QacA subfamily drug resistance transporter